MCKGTSYITVTTFNSCTKCMGSRGQYTTARPIATRLPGHEWMDDLTTESSFVSPATWVINLCGLFLLTCYNQALQDVRSTGVGIKCLYCTVSDCNSLRIQALTVYQVSTLMLSASAWAKCSSPITICIGTLRRQDIFLRS